MTDTAQHHNILVIEDEDNIAIALDYLLTREGYRATRIATGAGAVALIRQTRPDLVLLDVMLPEVSGYEICQTVRSDVTLSDVKILMMTARGSAMERRKGIAMGADGFISKPFELKALRAEVARILSGETTEVAPIDPAANGDSGLDGGASSEPESAVPAGGQNAASPATPVCADGAKSAQDRTAISPPRDAAIPRKTADIDGSPHG